MLRIRALLIAGPTASGKSALALDLARRLDGAVVNADSMQVYRDLRVLSARPPDADLARAEHRLYGHIDAGVNYSVGLWLVDVAQALRELGAAGRPAIITGGTGLYFKALTQGLSDMPAVPEAVRASVRAAAQGKPPQALHAELAAKDPATAAALRPTDPQRIMRALEVFAATGRPLATFQGARAAPLLAQGAWRGFFIAPDRDALRARIDARFVDMMAQGGLQEARALGARNLDPALPAMRAHGIPGLLAHLRGEVSLNDAIARGQADTRAYAKRQHTFARHQLPDFQWIAPDDSAVETILEKGTHP
ncbi:MAG: tRNA (adenosine(37)-N6)-dimethylallyltransferase MiaA [Hyphomicrobiales bacterium]|nr:tRNA (adenosine(37)-N6)-dimethylallyltransferase MiaA [Hyphomicrobiales bacterium]